MEESTLPFDKTISWQGKDIAQIQYCFIYEVTLQGAVLRKMVELDPGLSRIVTKVFLSKNI